MQVTMPLLYPSVNASPVFPSHLPPRRTFLLLRSCLGQVQDSVARSKKPAARHVLPRFISVSSSRAQFLHLNGKKLWEICKRGVLFVPAAGHELPLSPSQSLPLSLPLMLGLGQAVKSSKHDVRCLIFFYVFRFPLLWQSLTLACSLALPPSLPISLSCTIFYIFMHDAFNHVMHMIFRRTLRPYPFPVPAHSPSSLIPGAAHSSISMNYALYTFRRTPLHLLCALLCFGFALSRAGLKTWGWSLAPLRYVAFYVARATFPFSRGPLETGGSERVIQL